MMIIPLTVVLIIINVSILQSEPQSILDTISSMIERLSEGAKAGLQRIMAVITDLFFYLSRSIYTAMILGGVFLNFTGINKRLGSQWIKGGVLLGLASEIGPSLLKSLPQS